MGDGEGFIYLNQMVEGTKGEGTKKKDAGGLEKLYGV
jgi:hypothetical protein